MHYDFSALNDKGFERLACDLLSAHYRTRVIRYKAGKDKGVDGSFFTKWQENIIQCKHYLRSGYSKLIQSLREEAKKVALLKPASYIVVTSLPLSRENKLEIQAIFSPYIKEIGDIFGQEDLNDLISSHRDIEKKHYQLWLSSTEVLWNIFNNGINGRSEFELKRILNKSRLYFPTKTHKVALKKLNTTRVVILSGEPGIGKTTLAENICLYFANKGFELVVIEEPINEAEQVFLPWRKQIFYFDDFLGSNYLEAIENRKDSLIVRFIERVREDKTKRFILTSRTNILNAWLTHSSKFSPAGLEKNELLIDVKTLTPLDKANILYNHIWFSHLEDDFLEQLRFEKRYRQLIDHKNFSPRLVEFIVDKYKLTGMDAERYWGYIKEVFDNPKEVWEHCFNSQSDDFTRNMVTLVVFNGGRIEESALKEGFGKLNELEQTKNSWHTAKNFQAVSSLAARAFLSKNNIDGIMSYSLFNPSISDFIHHEYLQDEQKLCRVFRALDTLESLRSLESLPGDILSQAAVSRIKNLLFSDAIAGKKNDDYTVALCYSYREDEEKKAIIVSCLQTLIQSPRAIGSFSKFLALLLRFKDELDLRDTVFLKTAVGRAELSIDEISRLIDIMRTDDEDEWLDIPYWIQSRVEDHLIRELNQEMHNKIWDYLEVDEDTISLDGLVGKLISEGDSFLGSNFEDRVVESLGFDMPEIVNGLDMKNALEEHLRDQQGDDDYDEGEYYAYEERMREEAEESARQETFIEALFERT